MDPLKIGVAVIESLANETRTGKELFETTLKYTTFENAFLEHEYFDVKDSHELLAVLDGLYQKAISERKFYFLHFEVHGKEGGIELKDGNTVSWAVMLPYLRNLNVLYRNQLAVYMAVCKGNSLVQHIMHTERAPFGLLMGSFSDIYVGDIVNAFEVFYTEFFKQLSPLDAYNAIKAMNLKSEFTVLTSQHVIDIFLELEREHNDKNRVLDAIDANFKDIEPKIKALEDFRSEIVSLYYADKVDPVFFLMKDLS